jgi:dipeptidyl aminopeptidase/acylaminoacyl peptidase
VRVFLLLFLAAATSAGIAGAADPPKAPRDTQPWWSPQGTTLAFFRESPAADNGHLLYTPVVRGAEADIVGEGVPRGFRPGSGELLVESASQTTVRDASDRAVASVPAVDAAWSPDGSRIAFLSGDALEVAAASGADATTLATGIVPPLSDGTGPVWSPDGAEIAIAAGSAVEVVPADGSSLPQVVFNQPGDNVNPTWSHDGTTLAFERFADGRWSIWLVAPDGTDAREAPLSSGASANNRFPQWSPVDGRLAFISDRSGQYALYVAAADGATTQPLIDGVNPGSPERWSFDGSELAVSSAHDCGRFGIYVVQASGSAQPVRRSNQCRIVGGAGADVIYGTQYGERIDGNGGNDRIFGNAGDDVVYGGAGSDAIGGGAGNDVIYGGAGNDILSGGVGNDVIYAGAGRDKVGCGPGVDTAYVQAGDTTRDCGHVRRG